MCIRDRGISHIDWAKMCSASKFSAKSAMSGIDPPLDGSAVDHATFRQKETVAHFAERPSKRFADEECGPQLRVDPDVGRRQRLGRNGQLIVGDGGRQVIAILRPEPDLLRLLGPQNRYN